MFALSSSYNNRSMRSSDQELLVVPKSRLRIKWDNAFQIVGLELCNSLLLDLKYVNPFVWTEFCLIVPCLSWLPFISIVSFIFSLYFHLCGILWHLFLKSAIWIFYLLKSIQCFFCWFAKQCFVLVTFYTAFKTFWDTSM